MSYRSRSACSRATPASPDGRLPLERDIFSAASCLAKLISHIFATGLISDRLQVRRICLLLFVAATFLDFLGLLMSMVVTKLTRTEPVKRALGLRDKTERTRFFGFNFVVRAFLLSAIDWRFEANCATNSLLRAATSVICFFGAIACRFQFLCEIVQITALRVCA